MRKSLAVFSALSIIFTVSCGSEQPKTQQPAVAEVKPDPEIWAEEQLEWDDDSVRSKLRQLVRDHAAKNRPGWMLKGVSTSPLLKTSWLASVDLVSPKNEPRVESYVVHMFVGPDENAYWKFVPLSEARDFIFVAHARQVLDEIKAEARYSRGTN